MKLDALFKESRIQTLFAARLFRSQRSMGAALALGILFTILPCRATAIQLVRTSSYTLHADQTISEELWIVADQQAILDGEVSNDVVALANQVDLAGSFRGDVFALAREVRFTGFAGDDLRLGGQTVFVQGRADRNGVIVAGAIEVDERAYIGKDAVLVAEQVICKGEVSSLYVVANEATVGGRIRGKLRIAAEDIIIMPGTVIEGDLVYTAPDDLSLDSRVIVKGSIRKTVTPPGGFAVREPTIRGALSFAMFQYAGALLVGLAFAALFPGTTGMAVQTLRNRPGWCGLVGFVAAGLIPTTAVVLLFSIIGIPLSLSLLASIGLLAYLAKTPVALLIGSALFRLRGPTPFRSVAAALTMGLFLLYGFATLPYIGSVVTGMTLMFGLGSLLTALFTRDRIFLQPPRPPPMAMPQPPPLSSHTQNENAVDSREDPPCTK